MQLLFSNHPKLTAYISETHHIAFSLKELLSVRLQSRMNSEQEHLVKTILKNIQQGRVEHVEASIRQYKQHLETSLPLKRLFESRGL